MQKNINSLKIEQHLQEWQAQIDRLSKSRKSAKVIDKINHYQGLINHYQNVLTSLQESAPFSQLDCDEIVAKSALNEGEGSAGV